MTGRGNLGNSSRGRGGSRGRGASKGGSRGGRGGAMVKVKVRVRGMLVKVKNQKKKVLMQILFLLVHQKQENQMMTKGRMDLTKTN